MSMSKRVTIRFDDKDVVRLTEYAQANGLDVAKAVREVVTTFLGMVEGGAGATAPSKVIDASAKTWRSSYHPTTFVVGPEEDDTFALSSK